MKFTGKSRHIYPSGRRCSGMEKIKLFDKKTDPPPFIWLKFVSDSSIALVKGVAIIYSCKALKCLLHEICFAHFRPDKNGWLCNHGHRHRVRAVDR